ncbi:MAG: T9SS type A sorting domain-containing protein [Bacteroidia bacterium]|nr:T9SS type A sorting domain-containing protein [Bacteroidia bacterium]
MKKIRIFCLLFFTGIMLSLNAQAPLSYFTGFDTPAEQAGWTMFRKGAASSYSWSIEQTGYSAANCLAHYYPVTSSAPTNDWYVSPVFNFAGGGKIDSLRTNFSGFGTPGTSDTIGIYLFKGSNNPSQASSIIKLFSFQNGTYTNDGLWHLVTNISIPAQSGNSYLAFKYFTLNNWLDVKFDNFKVKINSTVGLADVKTSFDNVGVYPNPATNLITLYAGENALRNEKYELKIYNALGELVLTKHVRPNESAELNLSNGVYFYRIEDEQAQLIKCGKLVIKTQ